jgi:hypothetical protein
MTWFSLRASLIGLAPTGWPALNAGWPQVIGRKMLEAQKNFYAVELDQVRKRVFPTRTAFFWLCHEVSNIPSLGGALRSLAVQKLPNDRATRKRTEAW